MEMDSTPAAAISRKEIPSAAKLLLVTPPFGDISKFVLTFQYRAFGIDNRVARINFDMDWRRDWPGPCLLSKLMRRIAYPIQRCWLVTKKALLYLSRTVRANTCVPSYTEHLEGDIEMGENDRREEAAAPMVTFSESPTEKAKDEFRRSIQGVFSNSELVDRVMMDVIGCWESFV